MISLLRGLYAVISHFLGLYVVISHFCGVICDDQPIPYGHQPLFDGIYSMQELQIHQNMWH